MVAIQIRSVSFSTGLSVLKMNLCTRGSGRFSTGPFWIESNFLVLWLAFAIKDGLSRRKRNYMPT